MRVSSAGKRLKVLVISHLYPDDTFQVNGGYGGAFVRDQLRALRELCDLRVVIPRDCVPRQGATFHQWWNQVATLPKRFNDDGLLLDVVRFAAPPPRRHFLLGYGAAALLPVWRRVRAIRREFDFNLIHAHTTVPDGILGVWLGKILGVPTVITSHGGDISGVPLIPWNQVTLRYTLNSAGRLIAVSSNLKERMLDLGVSNRKITVIPNGFDPAKFPIDGNGNTQAARQGLRKVILFLGRLVPVKNPMILVQAFSCLGTRSDNVSLVMVGDGPLRHQVEEQIRQLGMTACVKLVGEIEHSKVAAYLRAADLLCLPSLSEGWPTVISEALSQGVPVVASRVGGIPEVICSDDYGLLVEPGNLASLTQALERALNTRWDHAKIRRYAATFTWRKIAELLHNEYRHVIRDTRTTVADLHQIPPSS